MRYFQMKIRPRQLSSMLGSMAALLALPLSSALHAQGSSTTNIFNVEEGLLNLPHITVLTPSNGDTESLYNTVLRHNGGNQFELIAVDEVQPQQECTRLEVLNAIPQLSMSLDIAAAEQLIGCDARITPGPTDPESGRLTYAVWEGVDGVSNVGNPASGYIGGSDTWISQTDLAGYNPFFVVGNAPRISLGFREAVLESVTYITDDTGSVCVNSSLLPGYAAIEQGDTVEQLNDKFGCTATRGQVVLKAGYEQRDYTWRAVTQPAVFASASSQLTDTVNQTVSLSIVNGQVQNRSLSETITHNGDTICTVDEILANADAVQTGQTVNSLSNLLACGPRVESRFTDDTVDRRTYQWQSQEPGSTLFVTVNRQLRISVVDGVVTSVAVNRM